MTGLKIPDNKMTNYLCKNFQLSKLNIQNEVHAVKFEPIVDNKNLVHHMIIYSCQKDLDVNAKEYECVEMQKDCEYVQGWAVGAGTVYTPDNVGVRIGGQYNNFILQVHYENMLGLKSPVDSSGFIISTTPHFRIYDSGSLIIGTLIDEIKIPPKLENYELRNECNLTCITGNLIVYSYGFHMHMIGKRISTELWRDGVRLSRIEENDYDFNRQGGRSFEPMEIKKYDSFVIRCGYNSMSKVDFTYGGETSMDEMCFNFVRYYPKVNGAKHCFNIKGSYNYCNK